MKWMKRLMLLAGGLLVVAMIVMAFMPQPVRVDIEEAARGQLEVAVRDDGMTRLRERYVVSTPIAGRLQRIEFDVGDAVIGGETVLARMEPTSPDLLDPREVALTRARVKAAEGRLRRAETDVSRARAALDQAEVELERQKSLTRQGATTDAQLEEAQLMFRTRSEELKASQFAEEIAEYELEQEKAALLHVSRENPSELGSFEFELTSPITGRVLRVVQESSAVLQPGAPLLELGDPNDLEIVVDVLSADAVRIQPGQRVELVHWGGDTSLPGVVRLVEPSGFTKISPLGVEEQRVNVIIDFAEKPSTAAMLGDGYRVEARIIVWSGDDVLSVPTGALFRQGTDWAVFIVDEGVAKVRTVKVGQNNGLRAQILSGIEPGEKVILHPSDQITEGVQVVPR